MLDGRMTRSTVAPSTPAEQQRRRLPVVVTKNLNERNDMITRLVRCLGVAALIQVVTFSTMAATSSLGSDTTLSGEQKQWHKISLTFTGPQASETDGVNPFR